MHSFLIKIAIEHNKAVLDVFILPAVVFNFSYVIVIYFETHPIITSVINYNTFFY